ncbi:NAD-dependent epimerase/dehydratase family protein [Peribacillus frigoritolerans]|uniref:NAD-dependent epimerase/dehydratase family protein n=1 Tax=Peribacillus frigoritolerans TaxID=450367 RepID=UPI00227EC6C3|nr:NAD-dependent epimerase/dehydratase family protein [Peribacillus frigoritolerans]MCY9006765.1 NAD-dependent epimerase/dehydratase family protein [Peribacillus frigoritolerans]
MKKVLVTGGFGFIGSHIVDTLIRNNYEVAIYDNLSTGSIGNVQAKVTPFFGNVEDEVLLENAMETFRPDYVIHQAAQVSVQQSISDITNDARINIMGTINIAKLSHKYAVKKIVFASSAAVYGNADVMPITLSHLTSPLSPYGASKKTAEDYLKLAKELYDLNYVNLRYSNVYGPRQTASGEGGVISIFTNLVIKNERPVIYGDGTQTRDFIYVKDVADANLKALEYEESGTFNVSSTTSTSINQLFSIIQSFGSNDLSPIYQPAKNGDIKESILCNKTTLQKLAWHPTHSLEQGLTSTYEYYLNQNQPSLTSKTIHSPAPLLKPTILSS